MCILHAADDSREVSALIRMLAGSRIDLHDHEGGEHIYVLDGSVAVGGELLGAGDYQYTRSGEVHDLVAQQDVTILSVLPLY